jgi:threonine dehydrogenase-like Zn-dependent dehydrogenase
MRAFVVSKPHQAAVEDRPHPTLRPGEVIIEVKAVGICGTDYHIYEGMYTAQYPIVPGHELAGVITEVGEGVSGSGWNKGDRVTVDPCLSCGQCRFCLKGLPIHCETLRAIGVTEPGALAEYVAVPAEKLYALPDNLSFEEGAFVESMACVVYGMHRLQLQFGSRVLIFGAGSIGQQLTQSLSRAGASELVAVDLSEKKLALAKQFGATKVVLGGDVQVELGKDKYSHGFDAVVDATGIPSVIQQALQYLGPASKFLQFGVAPRDSEIRVNPFELYHNDWTLIGSMAINHTFPQALDWLTQGRIDVKPLISETIELDQLADFLEQPKGRDLLKVQVRV